MKKWMVNTDTVDIDAKSIGIKCFDASDDTEILDNRGLSIQIRHNGRYATGLYATRMAEIIANALNDNPITFTKNGYPK